MTRRAAALLAALSLLGCGRLVGARDPNTLVVWETYAEEEHKVFLEIVRDFEKWYRETYGEDVRVEVELIPFDGHLEKIKFSAITHTAPDIARVDAGSLVDLAYGQAVLDLTEIDAGIDSFLRTFMVPARETVRVPVPQADGGVREGVYGVPDQITGVAVYYNKEMLARAGLRPPPATLEEMEAWRARGEPWDWDRFRAYARALTDTQANLYGVGLYNGLWFSFPFFNTFGADFVEIDADGNYRCVLNSDSGVRALSTLASFYWDGVEAGAWVPGAVGPDAGFAQGKYAMFFSGPWNLKQIKNVEFGLALVPEGPFVREVEARGRTFRVGTSTNVGGTDMVILKSARNPTLAYRFLTYFTSAEVYARWCNELGQIPVNQAAEPLVDFERNPALKTFTDQMRTAGARPRIPRYGILDGQIMAPQIERAFRGGNVAEVRKALDSAVADIERLILGEVNAK